MGNLAIENATVDHRIRALRFLPGKPGDYPSINFRGYEDTGLRYDPNTKSIIMSFDGTDVYTFDDTGGLTATVTYNFSGEDGITAFATGGQASATALSATKQLHRVSVCATAADSVKLPAATVGQAHFVRNDGVAAMQVFGQATETINGVASATGISQAPGMGVWYSCTTAGAWTTSPVSVVTASISLGVKPSSVYTFLVSQGNFVAMANAVPLQWSSTTDASGSADLILRRDAANTLTQRNGTTSQTYQLYNTFTDASNYERAELLWVSNLFTIQTASAGTGAVRNLGLGVPTGGIIRFQFAGGTIYSMDVNAITPGTDVNKDLGATATFFREVYVRRRVGKIATVTYSASMTPDASLGEYQEITVTNGTAFTINVPTNPLTGQSMNIKIKNTSGGAAGVATFNAVFKLAAWTQPATAFNRSIEFYYDGTNWIEFGRTTVDVPN